MEDEHLITTENLAGGEQVAVWRDWMTQQFDGLDCDVYGDRYFDGSIDRRTAGDVVLVRLQANRHRVIRTAALARACHEDNLKLILPIRGYAAVEQDGRQTQVAPGSWTIYDTSTPYVVENPATVDHLVVMVPRLRLLTVPSLGGLTAQAVAAAGGVPRLALETLRKAWQELPLMDGASARGVGEVILQLIGLSLVEFSGHATGLGRDQALRDRTISVIVQNLRDPDLTVERLAALLGCSKRKLHGVFHEADESPAQIIRRLRLEGCMRELRAPEAAHRSVTEIALSWGFNNPSHFGQLFRQAAGCTPNEFRQQRLA